MAFTPDGPTLCTRHRDAVGWHERRRVSSVGIGVAVALQGAAEAVPSLSRRGDKCAATDAALLLARVE